MRKKLSNIAGMTSAFLLYFILLICIPMTIPRLFGYEIFHIISGSMEPALPVGSAIYVEKTDPQKLEEGDVAAFWVDGEVVIHRIVICDRKNQVFYTKGDANEALDKNPVPYQEVIGRMKESIPYLGIFLSFFSSQAGKEFLLGFVVAAVFLKVIQKRLCRENMREKAYRLVVTAGTMIAILLLIVVTGIYAKIKQYRIDEKTDQAAVDRYTVQTNTEKTKVSDKEHCPITVDFTQLQKMNPDIVAWIYCDDSVINYPVCRGENDFYYLTHSYEKKEKISGSIFMETQNAKDLSDANIILYGHHMKNKSMFATLEYWKDEAYYKEHPFMWLLTPDEVYRIDLFAGYVTDALAETYTVYRGYAPELQEYLKGALEKSDFTAMLPDLEKDIQTDQLENKKFIVLSTCEYSAKNARYVLHGELVTLKN